MLTNHTHEPALAVALVSWVVRTLARLQCFKRHQPPAHDQGWPLPTFNCFVTAKLSRVLAGLFR